MRKPNTLVSGITKKSLRLMEGRRENLRIFPCMLYLVYNALRIQELKIDCIED